MHIAPRNISNYFKSSMYMTAYYHFTCTLRRDKILAEGIQAGKPPCLDADEEAEDYRNPELFFVKYDVNDMSESGIVDNARALYVLCSVKYACEQEARRQTAPLARRARQAALIYRRARQAARQGASAGASAGARQASLARQAKRAGRHARQARKVYEDALAMALEPPILDVWEFVDQWGVIVPHTMEGEYKLLTDPGNFDWPVTRWSHGLAAARIPQRYLDLLSFDEIPYAFQDYITSENDEKCKVICRYN